LRCCTMIVRSWLHRTTETHIFPTHNPSCPPLSPACEAKRRRSSNARSELKQ
jgi:hypothetical protein